MKDLLKYTLLTLPLIIGCGQKQQEYKTLEGQPVRVEVKELAQIPTRDGSQNPISDLVMVLSRGDTLTTAIMESINTDLATKLDSMINSEIFDGDEQEITLGGSYGENSQIFNIEEAYIRTNSVGGYLFSRSGYDKVGKHDK